MRVLLDTNVLLLYLFKFTVYDLVNPDLRFDQIAIFLE